jgi:peptide/nickel transport system permease protein
VLVAGLVLLLAVIAAALLTSAGPRQSLDVRAHRRQNEPPSGAHCWAPTRRARRRGIAAARAADLPAGGVRRKRGLDDYRDGVGIAAGASGWTQAAICTGSDFFPVIPGLVLAIVLASVLNRGGVTIVIAIGVAAGWPRLVDAVADAQHRGADPSSSRALGPVAGSISVGTLPAVLLVLLTRRLPSGRR